MVSILFVVGGIIAGIIGLAAAYYGWQKHQQHELITETETTEIRNIDTEGPVELIGEISNSEEDNKFVSPIGRKVGTVFSAWKSEEWSEHGDWSSWRTLANGIQAEPFHIDDGTGQVQVAIEDCASKKGFLSRHWSIASEGVAVDGVVCELDDFSIAEVVGAESDSPAHIEEFVRGESALAGQSGSITNVVDVGKAHGDRRYYERAFGPGEEIYLIGHVQATDGATTPLGPEDVVISPTNGTFILSNLSEDALIDRLNSSYQLSLGLGVVAIVVAIGLFVAGTTPLL